MYCKQGSLHTRTKSRDLEIVRTRKKCPNAVPTHLHRHVVGSQILKCSVKLYVAMPSTKCYFNEYLFMWALTHNTTEETNGCEHLEYHGLLVLC